MKINGKTKEFSISAIMTMLVMGIVFVTLLAALLVFLSVYRNSAEENATTTSEQAVVQVSNMISGYTDDMNELMGILTDIYEKTPDVRKDFLNILMQSRTDVEAVVGYDTHGNITEYYAKDAVIKDNMLRDLSFEGIRSSKQADGNSVSNPHVQTLFANYYPWVVTLSHLLQPAHGVTQSFAMDIQFSKIANYVDGVGIGQHGYCFLMDQAGNIIYHPQQQLIFSGLKEENTALIAGNADGTTRMQNIIYTVKTMDNIGWRIVGVSFFDEMVTGKMSKVVRILFVLLLLVLGTAIISSVILSRMISKPIHSLVIAMGEFEKKAAAFSYEKVGGTKELLALSDSFGHMVVRIQELMEKVRNEEITLRKTELNALQAQINPHFLYNTLDAIGWLCEEGRNQDAVEMVNALAKLFRISISKGHEMIPIEQELQHAKSYLKIEKYRYKNQFTYSFIVDERCLACLCNKITLQPIIENAIYHGLNRMIEEGEIIIRIGLEEKDVVFTVEDNGIGMTKEQCQEILGQEPSERAGIGIKNVNDRIKIYFGERYGLTIESEPDVGTKVTIRMPQIWEEDHETK